MALMQFPTEIKNKITYFTALSLFLSIAENALPHPLPFFRLGLASIPLLLALPLLTIKPYLFLIGTKWFVSSLSSGTLLSPFALMSFTSAFASGLAMYILYKVGRRYLSLYSISAISATLSGFIQIAISSLILTNVVFTLLPYMLLFSIFSGLFTAFIALRIEVPKVIKLPQIEKEEKDGNLILPILLIVALALICFSENLVVLTLCFLLSLLLSIKAKRRVLLHIHFFTFITIVIFSLLTPSGKVLWSFITEEALLDGIRRGLIVITTVALSQCFSAIKTTSSSFISSVIALSGEMANVFADTKGSFRSKIKVAINCQFANNLQKKQNNIPNFTLICILSLIIALCIGIRVF